MPIYMRVFTSADLTLDGDSTSAQYRDWFNVMSFSWGEANASSGGIGRTTPGPFTILKPSGKSSPALMVACASGRNFFQVIIAVTVAGQGRQDNEIERFVLSHAMLSSYDIGGDGGSVPVETLQFNFDAIDFTQQTSGGAQVGHWNFSSNSGG